MPLLPVKLQHGGKPPVETFGLVDSGATTSMFNAEWAVVLGHTLDPALAGMATGIGGNTRAWHFPVTLVVLGQRLQVTVAFSEGCPKEFGLLGRDDFLSAFRVGFEHPSTQLLLQAFAP